MPESLPNVLATVDAHVHLHPCHAADELFDHALRNLADRPGTGTHARVYYLLLTESAGDDAFGALAALAQAPLASRQARRRWQPHPTAEPNSLCMRTDQNALVLVAGRQVACREGLEVLLPGELRRIPDGLPIREVLESTRASGLPRVIPWGPGKWFGRRGRLLRQLVDAFAAPTLFLGDEGGRPGFWSYPAEFERAARHGVRDLPGTDPLPFPDDIAKVGRMGITLVLPYCASRPAHSLLSALTNPAVAYERFARLEPPLRFVRHQIGMQLRKRTQRPAMAV